MAQLFRFLYMDDRHRSEVFTFMIPSSFILDVDTDLKSRDFTSSHQKWSLSFSKLDGQLSAFVTLKSAYEGMTVTADYSITLINREHFTRNESFSEKTAKFTFDNASQGRRAFVSIEALCTLDFMDERGNIQCELEIKNVNTVFNYDAQIPPTPSYNRNPDLKYVSGSLAFGNYEWAISIQPKLDQAGNISYLKFYLYRLTSLDHLCRISYRYKFISGSFVHDSGVIEQYSDINGASNSFRMDKVRELLQSTGKFTIRLELIKVNSVFPIMLYPFAEQPQPVNFQDRDRQTWLMESCIEDNCFILRLFYADINNIPSGYVRVLSFNISVRHQHTGPVYVFKKPVIKYYFKREADDGLEITTTIDVNEMTQANSGYLDPDGGVTVEVEWNYSHLLHQPEYSHLDDIIRKQKLQMTREIQTLQQENYSLEKQVHTLQLGGGVGNQVPGGVGGGGNMMPPMGGPNQQSNRIKSFDNPSASSTASSGVGTSISSLNATNSSLNSAASAPGAGGPQTPNVVKKYMEQKYGNNPNNMMNNTQQQMNNNQNANSPSTSLFNSFLNPDKNNPSSRTSLGSGLFNQLTGGGNNNNNNNNPNMMNNNMNNPNNPNMNMNDNPLGAGLSSFTSKFSFGLDSLKQQATNFQANKLTSKLMNPFSSNN